MITMLVATQKGGVGKSAVVCQMGHLLHFRRGLRVLVIDLDDQANTSRSLVKARKAAAWRLDAASMLLNARAEIDACDATFAVICASNELRRVVGNEHQFGQYLANFRAVLAALTPRFDVCLIDCPPSADVRPLLAQAVADCMLSPIQPSQEAVDGVTETLYGKRGALRVKATFNPSLRVLGILPNLVDNTPLHGKNMVAIARAFKPYLIADRETGVFLHIPRRSSIEEAQARGIPLWELGRSRSAAREAWAVVRPCLETIATLMLETKPATSQATDQDTNQTSSVALVESAGRAGSEPRATSSTEASEHDA